MLGWTRRRGLGIVLVGLVAFLLNAAVSSWVRRPEPAFHDEFSYLLAADTFAEGRLTNPTHPLWIHFESFHIIHEPSYQSKYPPAQGLVLAAGQVLGGHPRVGLWLGMGSALAALTWMLQGWMAPRWALFGGLVAAVHPYLVAWWGQTYWGGATAMFGGALVFGVLGRMRRGARTRHALVLGAGLVILADSRPLEGLLVSLPAMALVLHRILVRPSGVAVSPRRFFPALAAVLVPAAAWTAYYNERVTRDPFTFPYQVWLETYQGSEAALRHPELRAYRGSPDITAVQKLRRLRHFYLPVPLLLPLLALPWMMRDRSVRFALLVCGATVAVVVVTSRGWPHYTAPMAPLVFLILAKAVASVIAAGRRWRPLGPVLTGSILAALVVSLVFLYVRQEPALWFQDWSRARAGILEALGRDERSHLVMVRYRPDHDVHREWVYNRADIDRAKVVWAREMTPEQNARLFDYFRYRKVWLLEADGDPPRLRPYPLLH